MRVSIDAQLTVGTATGIGEYVVGLSNALREIGVDVIELSEADLDPWRFDRRVFWDQVLLPQRARASAADVLHCAAGTMPLSPGLPCVVTVHDVAWLRVQSHTRPYARYYFGSFSLDRYRTAQQLVVSSNFSRDELFDVMNWRNHRSIEVVYPGVSSEFIELERTPSNEGIVLVVGTIERRKNLEMVIRALAHLPTARLVAIGPFTSYVDECMSLAHEVGVLDRVDIRGYAPRADVLALYATCSVLALPSRYEGFGYAAAQALCAGTPLICSDAGSLAEIVRGDAPTLDPSDVDSWVATLRDVLANPERWEAQAALVRARSAERFGWAASAKKMAVVYQKTLLESN